MHAFARCIHAFNIFFVFAALVSADIVTPSVSDDSSAPRLRLSSVPNVPLSVEFAGVLASDESVRWEKDGELLPAGTESSLVIPLVTMDDAGVYRPVVMAAGASRRFGQEVLLLVKPRDSARNLSVRLDLREGDLPILGVVLDRGEARQQLLVRGIGPSLSRFGLSPGKIAKLRIYDSEGSVVEEISPAMLESDLAIYRTDIEPKTGAFPASVGDVVTLLRLPPGAFTIHVVPAQGGTGTVLVEMYLVE